MKVDIWSDIACPWCFIGKRRFEAGLADFGHRDQVEVTWHSYQLDPSIPERYDGTELDYLAKRKGMDPDQVRRMLATVEDAARGEGLNYDFEHLVVANSYPAHELLHLAKARGVADAVKEALLSAHFEKAQDTSDREVLVRIGTEAGLDADEIRAALDEGRYREAVRADISQAAALGISGVPFFVIDGRYGVSGAQPAELFTRALTTAWDESHTIVPLGEQTDSTGEGACGPDGCAV